MKIKMMAMMMMMMMVMGMMMIEEVESINNGLGKTPQMGWNSWNEYGCDINQTLIQQTIEQMINLGLLEVGYQYVNLDDCWQSWRNSSGIIQPDNSTFPDGIAPLAAYAHSRGLKFGLYSDAGDMTCQRRPGSLGYETLDAQTYASWGVDYLKYDNCYNENIPPKQRYPVMRDALNATGRAIFYSMCEWGQDQPALWAPQVGNSWRTTSDIKNTWDSIMYNIDLNDRWWKQAAPGGWNDPDMLECPNPANPLALTESEFEVHFTLWALAKAPLIIGCNLDTLSAHTLAVLKNKDLIAVNQDPLGVQGHLVDHDVDANTDVWAGPLSGGRAVAALVNRDAKNAHTITLTFAQLGFASSVTSVTLRDLLTNSDFQKPFTDPIIFPNVAPRSVVAVSATPQN